MKLFSGPFIRWRFIPALLPAMWGMLAFARAVDFLPPGHRPIPPGVHALVGGKVVVKPGEVLDGATIVIRDGLIAAVGRDVTAPADARVWDMKGATIYAGFIDAYLQLGNTNPPVSTSDTQPIGISAASGVNFYGVPGQEKDPGNPGPGYELRLIQPENRVAPAYVPNAKTLEGLREIGFTAANLTPSRGILRGTSAFVMLGEANPNEAILKADVFHHVAFEPGAGGEVNGGRLGGFPGSLMGVIAAVRQSFFDAQHYGLDQADYQQHPQARKRPAFNPSLEALAPAVAQKMPVVFEPGSSLMVDRAARLAAELKLKLIVCASGQEWRRPELAKAAGAPFIVPVNYPAAPKLPEEDDWTQVTLDQLRVWDWAPENPAVLRQQGVEIALTTYGLGDMKNFRKNVQLALDRGLSENDALAALTTIPARLCGVEAQLGTIEKGKLANLTVVDGGGYFDPENKIHAVWIDGRIYRAAPAPPKAAEKPKENKEARVDPQKDEKTKAEVRPDPKADPKKKAAELRELQKKRVARSPQEGRGPITNPSSLLIRNATIWTSGDQGVLTNANLLIAGGKIQAVGYFKAELAANTLEIDATGEHLTPGLIDCHSHTAILGSVNEATIPSSAMVRISDVVNSETDNLYQQLAGGLTTANLLHGSANPIGGQNCVIKLKDGAAPEELKLKDAPPGIKFALGENVKQSNWGEQNKTRFPQTRMGVQTFINNRFVAAQQYLREWDGYRKNGGVPPRRDLELEAVGEIIEGKRLIHCHSYRQDEILMLIRLMDGFGVKIATFQHVLEGYKVADEIARHGAGGSAFADWWGYKFEVYDAIPYAGSLMRDRGVTVSFNSDSSDYARRLYQEAAKAVKYGGTPEAEALKFVTLNPAKQLHIEARVGSLEPGKDADFALWSKSPLAATTVCLQTWIEGQKYFDRALSDARFGMLQKERADLIAKAKKLAGAVGPNEGGDAARAAFFRSALERAHAFGVLQCQDCQLPMLP